jgi:hypothetical protein
VIGRRRGYGSRLSRHQVHGGRETSMLSCGLTRPQGHAAADRSARARVCRDEGDPIAGRAQCDP